ncbi:hypothetical protein [uncultured Sphingomonas sp.]|uniref:hypothetical protein n=1 Tax=uncultured Sphingomonas sp. TaxID=158754 RepID=UPI0025E60FFE|nr:hypothetical protein [uncultured Sphingomonas sp.]
MFVDFRAEAIDSADLRHPPVGLGENLYDRGIACSCASETMDLVEAHKWFNLAAMHGDPRAAAARTSLALDMTAREVAEAQRRARTHLRTLN